MGWHTGRLLLIDAETTGTNPHQDRIVTFAAIEAGGGQDTHTREWLLNPGVPIPAEATAVHGVTDEDAHAGRDPAEALAEVALVIINASKAGVPVVGHNVVFDLSMLHTELARHGQNELAGHLRVLRPVVDTLLIEKTLDPYRPGKPNGRRPDEACGRHTLTDCCRLWGVPLSEADAHGATADALAAGRLLWRLATNPGRFSQFDHDQPVIEPASMTLDALHDWQVRRYASEEARFQSYMRGEDRKRPVDPDPGFVAEAGWPIH